MTSTGQGAKGILGEILRAQACGKTGCPCQTNGSKQTHCPAHDDRNPSLSVDEKNGRILVHCHVGCEGNTVIDVLKERNLWPSAVVKAAKKVQVAQYDYKNLSGTLVFQVVRFEDKTFIQRQPDGRGGWQWNLGGVTRFPYYADKLAVADPEAMVYIPEGEKDVDRLWELGRVATCNPGGAGKWRKSYSENYLKGRHVVILPDNDGPGRDHAEKVAKLTHPFAASVKVIELPGLPEKGDVSDWLDAGNAVDELTALVEAALQWSPKKINETQIPDPTTDAYRTTDVGNGRRLAYTHGADVRYISNWNSWIWWNGIRWERDHTEALPRLAKSVIDRLFDEAAAIQHEAAQARREGKNTEADRLSDLADSLWSHAKRSEGSARIAAMLEMSKSEPGIAITPDQLDARPWDLNCLNGTIDLTCGTLRPHRREDLHTKVVPVAFVQDATLELWDTFLLDVIPDPGTRAYAQRCIGATVAGVARDDLLLVIHGEGGTGKSTFLNSIQATLGDYAASADLASFTTRRDAGAPQPDLARLQGRRMVAISEPGTGNTFSLLKKATGGDPITTRSHHQETFEFVPQFTIWVITNKRPQVPHDDTGIWRRIREIPFTNKFKIVDTSIRTTLTNPSISGEAILAWMVQGRLEWQRDGIGNLPQQVVEATAAYREEMDPLVDWIEDNIESDSVHWVPFKESWANYQGWAKENGIRRQLGLKTFAQRLGEKYTPSKGTGGVRGNTGLALKGGDSGISQLPLTPDNVVDN